MAGKKTTQMLTLYLWSLCRFIKVILSVQLGVLVQRAFVCEGEHILQDVHLPQDLTQTVDAHGFLMSDYCTPQVGFTCMDNCNSVCPVFGVQISIL